MEYIRKFDTQRGVIRVDIRNELEHVGFIAYDTLAEYVFRAIGVDDYMLDTRLVYVGDYQGDVLFIQRDPDYNGFLVGRLTYGSCSGCDTLKHILSGVKADYDDDKETFEFDEKVVDDLVTLCLHIFESLTRIR